MPDNTAVSCAKMAEPIDLLWVVDLGGPKEAKVELYSALRQITLTTCFISYAINRK